MCIAWCTCIALRPPRPCVASSGGHNGSVRGFGNTSSDHVGQGGHSHAANFAWVNRSTSECVAGPARQCKDARVMETSLSADH